MDGADEIGDAGDQDRGIGHMQRVRSRHNILFFLFVLSVLAMVKVRPYCPLRSVFASKFYGFNFTASILVFLVVVALWWFGCMEEGLRVRVAIFAIFVVPNLELASYFALVTCKDLRLLGFVGVAAGIPIAIPLELLAQTGHIGPRVEITVMVLLAAWYASFAVARVWHAQDQPAIHVSSVFYLFGIAATIVAGTIEISGVGGHLQSVAPFAVVLMGLQLERHGTRDTFVLVILLLFCALAVAAAVDAAREKGASTEEREPLIP